MGFTLECFSKAQVILEVPNFGPVAVANLGAFCFLSHLMFWRTALDEPWFNRVIRKKCVYCYAVAQKAISCLVSMPKLVTIDCFSVPTGRLQSNSTCSSWWQNRKRCGNFQTNLGRLKYKHVVFNVLNNISCIIQLGTSEYLWVIFSHVCLCRAWTPAHVQ